jgi:hypothetical protein
MKMNKLIISKNHSNVSTTFIRISFTRLRQATTQGRNSTYCDLMKKVNEKGGRASLITT